MNYYLKNKLTKPQLEKLLLKLALKPDGIIRKNESIWKDNFKDKLLTDDELIAILVEYPKLIESPIVINNKVGVIGRHVEKIFEII